MILLKIVTNSLIQSTRFQIRAEILFACFKETDRRLLLTVSFLCNCGETPSQLSMNGINVQIDENFFTAVILNMEVRQHEKEIENNKGITNKFRRRFENIVRSAYFDGVCCSISESCF